MQELSCAHHARPATHRVPREWARALCAEQATAPRHKRAPRVQVAWLVSSPREEFVPTAFQDSTRRVSIRRSANCALRAVSVAGAVQQAAPCVRLAKAQKKGGRYARSVPRANTRALKVHHARTGRL
jgi:hypothetical protein